MKIHWGLRAQMVGAAGIVVGCGAAAVAPLVPAENPPTSEVRVESSVPIAAEAPVATELPEFAQTTCGLFPDQSPLEFWDEAEPEPEPVDVEILSSFAPFAGVGSNGELLVSVFESTAGESDVFAGVHRMLRVAPGGGVGSSNERVRSERALFNARARVGGVRLLANRLGTVLVEMPDNLGAVFVACRLRGVAPTWILYVRTVGTTWEVRAVRASCANDVLVASAPSIPRANDGAPESVGLSHVFIADDGRGVVVLGGQYDVPEGADFVVPVSADFRPLLAQ